MYWIAVMVLMMLMRSGAGCLRGTIIIICAALIYYHYPSIVRDAQWCGQQVLEKINELIIEQQRLRI